MGNLNFVNFTIISPTCSKTQSQPFSRVKSMLVFLLRKNLLIQGRLLASSTFHIFLLNEVREFCKATVKMLHKQLPFIAAKPVFFFRSNRQQYIIFNVLQGLERRISEGHHPKDKEILRMLDLC